MRKKSAQMKRETAESLISWRIYKVFMIIAFVVAIFAASVIILSVLSLFSEPGLATPEGPTIVSIKNETNTPDTAALINTTGGSITTMTLNATTQNLRWKAYVGNVTGTLTLDDASGSTIYNWQVSSPNGEIYATRKTDTVSWSNIACANITHIENENRALNHTNKEDNISATFNTQIHDTFYAGTRLISNNTCYSVYSYVNDTAQSSVFDEIALYDGTNATNGNIVYASLLEQNSFGYNNQTVDFQMILPEYGLATWTSSTAYYFYVELS